MLPPSMCDISVGTTTLWLRTTRGSAAVRLVLHNTHLSSSWQPLRPASGMQDDWAIQPVIAAQLEVADIVGSLTSSDTPRLDATWVELEHELLRVGSRGGCAAVSIALSGDHATSGALQLTLLATVGPAALSLRRRTECAIAEFSGAPSSIRPDVWAPIARASASSMPRVRCMRVGAASVVVTLDSDLHALPLRVPVSVCINLS
ncbi:MAG: hypothetical protein EBY28_26500, partial [Betaproteobacteria bacterium]|nr:hypothetical protein [Betaproteobacteria bacterium]